MTMACGSGWLAGDAAVFDPSGGLWFFSAVRVPVVDVAEAGFYHLQAVEEGADFPLAAEPAEVAPGIAEGVVGHLLADLGVVGYDLGDGQVAPGGEVVHHAADH